MSCSYVECEHTVRMWQKRSWNVMAPLNRMSLDSRIALQIRVVVAIK